MVVSLLLSGTHGGTCSFGIQRKKNTDVPDVLIIFVLDIKRVIPRTTTTRPHRNTKQTVGAVAVPTRSGEIHRRQFGTAKSVVNLMALGNAWRQSSPDLILPVASRRALANGGCERRPAGRVTLPAIGGQPHRIPGF